MYNRTYQYFRENDVFSSKQFGFQVNNSITFADDTNLFISSSNWTKS